MALEQGTAGLSSGAVVLVSAGIVYEIIAANCSSPQTTELNASTRADTLFKWVHLGAAQALIFLAVAFAMDSRHRLEIAAGGGLALVMMYGLYGHAKRTGLASDKPGTEQW